MKLTRKIVALAALLTAFAGCAGAPGTVTAGQPSTDAGSGATLSEVHKFPMMVDPHVNPAVLNSFPPQLIDHGGRVLPTANVYSIWWGPPDKFPKDAQQGVTEFFKGLTDSSFLGISTQYMRGAPVAVNFKGNIQDPNIAPPVVLSQHIIASEVCSTLYNEGIEPDPHAIYFVFTANFPFFANYCAWHYYAKCGKQVIQFAYMPNVANVKGCQASSVRQMNCNTYSNATQALVNVASHEFMEAITDANVNAWSDKNGLEISDKCAWRFKGCVNLTNGSWQLQENWSNQAVACVQQ